MGDKTVSLVHSNGGARGMAHIGDIETLEERRYKIVSVAGSSELDVLIENSRMQAGTLDFHKAPELIHIGKQKMNEALDKLEYGN